MYKQFIIANQSNKLNFFVANLFNKSAIQTNIVEKKLQVKYFQFTMLRAYLDLALI